jgi:hypothetical protein
VECLEQGVLLRDPSCLTLPSQTLAGDPNSPPNFPLSTIPSYRLFTPSLSELSDAALHLNYWALLAVPPAVPFRRSAWVISIHHSLFYGSYGDSNIPTRHK